MSRAKSSLSDDEKKAIQVISEFLKGPIKARHLKFAELVKTHGLDNNKIMQEMHKSDPKCT